MSSRRRRSRAVPVAGPGNPRPPARPDVVALVFGLLLTGVGGTSLWLAFAGTLDWSLLKTVAPLGLVAVGVIGLLSSRRR